MRFHYCSLLLMTTVMSCSVTTDITNAAANKVHQVSCPILKNDKWHAWIDKGGVNKDLFRLNIRGEVTLPNSGYQISWLAGPMDRMHPPKLRLNIVPKKVDDMSLQVLTTQPVIHIYESKLKTFRVVAIYCEGTLLTEIVDVNLTD